MSELKVKVIGKLADIKAVCYFIREGRMKREPGKKRVAFLCQYIPAWNKMQPVYELMKKDSRFETYLICVPSGIQDQKLLNPELLENDTYEYFREHGYEEALNALVGKNQWLDLEKLKLNYIFYPRPYNSFMPRSYTSNRVSRYTKICCLMYGMELTKTLLEVTLDRDFFRNVYCYFAESKYMQEANQRRLRLTHRLGLQKTLYYGMPALAQILEARNESNSAWDFSKNDFRVMWAPRWTSDPRLGGTNYFVYKDLLLDYAKEHKDIDFLLRPHPLMFDHFIQTKEMTPKEVADYRARVEGMSNVSFDREPEYGATFWKTDVLIGDMSGILPEYLMTGKPLIYCASNMELELSDMADRMFEGCYVARTPEELFSFLGELKKGKDVLFEKRREIIWELFGDVKEAGNRIVEELAQKK